MFESVSAFLPAPALGDGVIHITSTGEVIALEQFRPGRYFLMPQSQTCDRGINEEQSHTQVDNAIIRGEKCAKDHPEICPA